MLLGRTKQHAAVQCLGVCTSGLASVYVWLEVVVGKRQKGTGIPLAADFFLEKEFLLS